MNRTTKFKLAYMQMTILDLQRRSPRRTYRPRIIPNVEELRAEYKTRLGPVAREYLKHNPWMRFLSY